MTPNIPVDGSTPDQTGVQLTAGAFADYPLSETSLATLAARGMTTPTPIQAAAIPALLAGRDVVGQARTGSGKTLAFGLPLLEAVDSSRAAVQALVLAPTRELASQVAAVITEFGAPRGVSVALLYGGTSPGPQRTALRRGAQVAVGTPGRILDLIGQGALWLDQARFVVLDEADEMFDQGFAQDVERIMDKTSNSRQTALFSATMPDWVRQTAARYLYDPETIAVDVGDQATTAVPHVAYVVPGGTRGPQPVRAGFSRGRDEGDLRAKLGALRDLLDHRGTGMTIVFGRTKQGVAALAKQLDRDGYPVGALQGNMTQAERDFVMGSFREGRVDVLVATNVAARGLDLVGVDLVVNIELPESGEMLTHRVGRTGRMGRGGQAITLLTDSDLIRWQLLTRDMAQPIELQPWPGAVDALRALEPDAVLAPADIPALESTEPIATPVDFPGEPDLPVGTPDAIPDDDGQMVATTRAARTDEMGEPRQTGNRDRGQRSEPRRPAEQSRREQPPTVRRPVGDAEDLIARALARVANSPDHEPDEPTVSSTPRRDETWADEPPSAPPVRSAERRTAELPAAETTPRAAAPVRFGTPRPPWLLSAAVRSAHWRSGNLGPEPVAVSSPPLAPATVAPPPATTSTPQATIPTPAATPAPTPARPPARPVVREIPERRQIVAPPTPVVAVAPTVTGLAAAPAAPLPNVVPTEPAVARQPAPATRSIPTVRGRAPRPPVEPPERIHSPAEQPAVEPVVESPTLAAAETPSVEPSPTEVAAADIAVAPPVPGRPRVRPSRRLSAAADAPPVEAEVTAEPAASTTMPAEDLVTSSDTPADPIQAPDPSEPESMTPVEPEKSPLIPAADLVAPELDPSPVTAPEPAESLTADETIADATIADSTVADTIAADATVADSGPDVATELEPLAPPTRRRSRSGASRSQAKADPAEAAEAAEAAEPIAASQPDVATEAVSSDPTTATTAPAVDPEPESAPTRGSSRRGRQTEPTVADQIDAKTPVAETEPETSPEPTPKPRRSRARKAAPEGSDSGASTAPDASGAASDPVSPDSSAVEPEPDRPARSRRRKPAPVEPTDDAPSPTPDPVAAPPAMASAAPPPDDQDEPAPGNRRSPRQSADARPPAPERNGNTRSASERGTGQADRSTSGGASRFGGSAPTGSPPRPSGPPRGGFRARPAPTMVRCAACGTPLPTGQSGRYCATCARELAVRSRES